MNIQKETQSWGRELRLKRAVYGKKGTPKEMREYTIEGSGSSAVGTLAEIKKVFPNMKLKIVEDWD